MIIIRGVSCLSEEKYLQGVGCQIRFVNSEMKFRSAEQKVVACDNLNKPKTVGPASAGWSPGVIVIAVTY